VTAEMRRVVVCLDVDAGRVVKGVRFEGLRDVGDPVELAARYESEGADEIVFLDVSASSEGRKTMLDVARRTAEVLFVPLTLGGGIRSADDAALALRAGADKVGMNSAAVADPSVLTDASQRFGAQCVVLSIDAKRESPSAECPSGYRVVTHGGRRATPRDAIAWAEEGVRRGAGEILLTSIDRDGARTGYDLELVRRVAEAVPVPVVASGGAGEASHLVDAFAAGADAALVAGILHDGLVTVAALKDAIAARGVAVRRART
jgi:cyclase